MHRRDSGSMRKFLGNILTAAMLVVALGAPGTGFSAKGGNGGGGGNPPGDDPPPPENFNPVIHKSDGLELVRHWSTL